MKRVPIPVVIVLSLAAIGIPWVQGTKDMDFMTPPNEATLAHIRSKTELLHREKSRLFSIRPEPKDTALIEGPIRAAPAIDPGDPKSPALLNEYAAHAAEGAGAFITLAVHLEEQGANARALLAWERVLDSCPEASEDQRKTALAGVQRLRPMVAQWNIEPSAAKQVVLEATLPANIQADALEEVVTKCANELSRYSSGLLHFEPRVERPERKGTPAAVLSLQLIDESVGAASTGLLDFPIPSDPDQLKREILAACYRLVASQLVAVYDQYTALAPLAETDNPTQALETRITRLCWDEFGKSLMPRNSR
ncbi:hypothetical protein [Haloferula sp. BvORR071]|uniref:hypothetical protein n=1 Tax=Haloferula sp. BvORR071 TaxID=1396141 RepID=UPI002240EA21|nr:hypothetical protein [Haloferula sp. BvORR071]